ncbi:MAG: protein-L-isoaspartate O-methyltransferase [Betaproteobacteria bacterium]|nr:protein-L-isoaspartate O-methyltransferase [Betaproteobacteria bacterium]
MNLEQARFNMIEQQIRPWDVLDQDILDLIGAMRREDFVPPALRSLAFSDTELPLPGGQSMLAPKVEARLLQELAVRKHEHALEIGAGSGFFAALLGHRAASVTSLELLPELADFARANLARAASANVQVVQADGSRYVPAEPMDIIVLSGSVAEVPDTLKNALKVGGRMAAIVGNEVVAEAQLITRLSEQDYRVVNLFETVAPLLRNFPAPSRFRF